jgi:hypothetical protein
MGPNSFSQCDARVSHTTYASEVLTTLTVVLAVERTKGGVGLDGSLSKTWPKRMCAASSAAMPVASGGVVQMADRAATAVDMSNVVNSASCAQERALHIVALQ